MTKDEALKLALEALKNTSPLGFNMESDKKFYTAITAIKEALAQPSQKQEIDRLKRCLFQMQEAAKDLAQRQRTWVDLTDDEWQELADKYDLIIWSKFRREIEAKLKEKNGYAEEKN